MLKSSRMFKSGQRGVVFKSPTLLVTEMTTRRLLKLKRETYIPDWYDEEKYGHAYVNGARISRETITAELNTREHVPGKKEAKLLRQMRAKQRKSTREVKQDKRNRRKLALRALR